MISPNVRFIRSYRHFVGPEAENRRRSHHTFKIEFERLGKDSWYATHYNTIQEFTTQFCERCGDYNYSSDCNCGGTLTTQEVLNLIGDTEFPVNGCEIITLDTTIPAYSYDVDTPVTSEIRCFR